MTTSTLVVVLIGLLLGGVIGYMLGHVPQKDTRVSVSGLTKDVATIAALF